MKTVGIRELKNRLSEYLREVRAGESVLVSDRGQIIAELAPPTYGRADSSMSAGLRNLARRGLVTLGSAPDATVYKAIPRKRRAHRTAAQLLDDERGSR